MRVARAHRGGDDRARVFALGQDDVLRVCGGASSYVLQDGHVCLMGARRRTTQKPEARPSMKARNPVPSKSNAKQKSIKPGSLSEVSNLPGGLRSAM